MTKTIIILFITLISFNIYGDESKYGSGIMEPLPDDLLSSPIYLEDSCSDTKIIEWKQTFNDKNTVVDNKSLDIIKHICKLTVDNFINFINTKTIYKIIEPNDKYKINICLNKQKIHALYETSNSYGKKSNIH